MAEMDVVTADHEGFRVTSNTAGSPEQLIKNLDVEKPPKEEPDLSKAASELGKKGGKAAAEKRKEALRTQGTEESEEKPQLEPDPDPEEETESEEEAPEKPAEKEGEEQPERLGKPRHDPKARMLEATRKEAEAKRARDSEKARADTLQAERDALKRELEASKAPKAVEEPPKPSGRPSRASFQSDEDFFEALADFKAEEKVNAYKAQTEAEGKLKEFTSTIDTLLARHKATGEEYEKTNPGWRDKLSPEVKELFQKPIFFADPTTQLTIDNYIGDELYLADQRYPALAVHLSEHPEELDRIKKIRFPQDVQVEMRLLARTLNGAAITATVPKGEISKAPPPVRPVAGAPPSVSEEGHTPERAAKESLDAYARGWKMPHRR